MIKRILVASLMALCLSLPSTAFANYKCSKKGEDQPKWKNKIACKVFKQARFYLCNAEELGLDEKQKNKILKLKIDLKKKLIKDQAQVDIAKVDLKSLLYQDRLNAIKIHSLIDKKYEIKRGMAKASVQSLVELKKVLTTEQQAKVKEICKKNKGAGQAGKCSKCALK